MTKIIRYVHLTRWNMRSRSLHFRAGPVVPTLRQTRGVGIFVFRSHKQTSGSHPNPYFSQHQIIRMPSTRSVSRPPPIPFAYSGLLDTFVRTYSRTKV